MIFTYCYISPLSHFFPRVKIANGRARARIKLFLLVSRCPQNTNHSSSPASLENTHGFLQGLICYYCQARTCRPVTEGRRLPRLPMAPARKMTVSNTRTVPDRARRGHVFHHVPGRSRHSARQRLIHPTAGNQPRRLGLASLYKTHQGDRPG